MSAENVEYKRMNKVILTYISAYVEFLRNIVESVHGYEQDKVLIFNYTWFRKGFHSYLILWYF